MQEAAEARQRRPVLSESPEAGDPTGAESSPSAERRASQKAAQARAQGPLPAVAFASPAQAGATTPAQGQAQAPGQAQASAEAGVKAAEEEPAQAEAQAPGEVAKTPAAAQAPALSAAGEAQASAEEQAKGVAQAPAEAQAAQAPAEEAAQDQADATEKAPAEAQAAAQQDAGAAQAAATKPPAEAAAPADAEEAQAAAKQPVAEAGQAPGVSTVTLSETAPPAAAPAAEKVVGSAAATPAAAAVATPAAPVPNAAADPKAVAPAAALAGPQAQAPAVSAGPHLEDLAEISTAIPLSAVAAPGAHGHEIQTQVNHFCSQEQEQLALLRQQAGTIVTGLRQDGQIRHEGLVARGQELSIEVKGRFSKARERVRGAGQAGRAEVQQAREAATTQIQSLSSQGSERSTAAGQQSGGAVLSTAQAASARLRESGSSAGQAARGQQGELQQQLDVQTMGLRIYPFCDRAGATLASTLNQRAQGIFQSAMSDLEGQVATVNAAAAGRLLQAAKDLSAKLPAAAAVDRAAAERLQAESAAKLQRLSDESNVRIQADEDAQCGKLELREAEVQKALAALGPDVAERLQRLAQSAEREIVAAVQQIIFTLRPHLGRIADRALQSKSSQKAGELLSRGRAAAHTSTGQVLMKAQTAARAVVASTDKRGDAEVQQLQAVGTAVGEQIDGCAAGFSAGVTSFTAQVRGAAQKESAASAAALHQLGDSAAQREQQLQTLSASLEQLAPRLGDEILRQTQQAAAQTRAQLSRQVRSASDQAYQELARSPYSWAWYNAQAVSAARQIVNDAQLSAPVPLMPGFQPTVEQLLTETLEPLQARAALLLQAPPAPTPQGVRATPPPAKAEGGGPGLSPVPEIPALAAAQPLINEGEVLAEVSATVPALLSAMDDVALGA